MTTGQFRWAAGIAAALAIAGATAGSARAQTPKTGDDVVRAMHDRYDGKWYKTLTFTQKTTRRTPADTMMIQTWYETAAVPGRLRIDIAPRPGTSYIFANDSIYVTNKDSVLRRMAGRNPLLILGFDVYGQSADKTLDVLHAEGFDTAPLHEDTWEGRPVYVVGTATKGDLHSKQFWVDKQRLLFVRLLEPSRGDSTKMDDTRFDDYRPLGGGWIAALVESYSGGKLIQKEEYTDIKADPPVPSNWFTPGAAN